MNKYLLSFLWTGVILAAQGAGAETTINVDGDKTAIKTNDIYQVGEKTNFYNGDKTTPGYHLKAQNGSILHINTKSLPASSDPFRRSRIIPDRSASLSSSR